MKKLNQILPVLIAAVLTFSFLAGNSSRDSRKLQNSYSQSDCAGDRAEKSGTGVFFFYAVFPGHGLFFAMFFILISILAELVLIHKSIRVIGRRKCCFFLFFYELMILLLIQCRSPPAGK
ncbi:MAG: hypothetical protein J5841_04955 [Clostridia bacterium]|nr:hypothetical protein [Clostridia bacterium]